MSATIKWQPPVSVMVVNVGAGGAFAGALAEVGYTLPCELTKEAIPTLRAMAAGSGPGDWRAALKGLADAIERYGSIRLWVEY